MFPVNKIGWVQFQEKNGTELCDQNIKMGEWNKKRTCDVISSDPPYNINNYAFPSGIRKLLIEQKFWLFLYFLFKN